MVTMATKKHDTKRPAKTTKKAGKGAARANFARNPSSADDAFKVQSSLDPNRPAGKPLAADRAAALEREESEARAAGQAGSLQGLSDLADAASESVDELIEEGNSLEAGIVAGVEDAPDADEGEIRTREVPEDDVPDEYLDNEP